jgi:four helix bundle protein
LGAGKEKDGLRLEAGRGRKIMVTEYLFPFEKLDVWKMSLSLGEKILHLLEQVPQNKHIRLVNQMEGAAISPAQNIAEGKGRQYKKEFIQFLHIAQGSLYEIVTLNEIFRRKGLFSEEEASEVRERCEQIDRKLNGLINSLRGKAKPSSNQDVSLLPPTILSISLPPT